MNTSEVLNRAADLIEERGWKTGGGWLSLTSKPDDTICLEGAIQGAIGHRFTSPHRTPDDEYDDLKTCPAYVAVSTYIHTEDELWNWNDAQQSAQRVIEALRACAVIEASRERESAEVTPEPVRA